MAALPPTSAPASAQGAYSFAQLEALWVNNGGNPQAAPTAAAIALAESSGNAGISTPEADNSTSYGLWQINSSHSFDLSKIHDPNYNAQQAIAISGNGANFMPWTTYWSTDGGKTNAGAGNGVYRKFLSGTQAAVSGASDWFSQLGSTVGNAISQAIGGAVTGGTQAAIGAALIPISIVTGLACIIAAVIWGGIDTGGDILGGNIKDALASNRGAAIGGASGAVARVRGAAAAAPEIAPEALALGA